MEIKLNEVEQLIARHTAKMRYQIAREKNRVNMKMGNQTNEFTDLNGVGAEIAFCKVFNIYPSLTYGEIDYYDCLLRDGIKADIKTTKYSTGRLLAMTTKKIGKCDVYVLVTGQFPIYRIVGYATGEELIKEENINDLGFGKGYMLTQNNLRKFNMVGNE